MSQVTTKPVREALWMAGLLTICMAAIVVGTPTHGALQNRGGAQNAGAQNQDGPTAAPKKRAAPRGRLPVYFSRVVDGTQRSKIYDIQAKYRTEIAALEAQIQTLRDKEAQEVDGVLTPTPRALAGVLASLESIQR